MGLVAAAIVALIVWGIYFALDPLRMPITAVMVKGDFRYLSREQLERVVADHAKSGFFGVDLGAVRNAALGLAWVKTVSVRRRWPERLHLDVREREAVARWATGGLVDPDGDLFNPPEVGSPADLPELEGPDGAHGLLLRRYREFQAWLVPAGLRIRRVIMSARSSWKLELADGPIMVLGRSPSETGIRRLARALPAIREKGGAGIIAVDLRYPNGFAIHWRRSAGAGENNES